jgi:hypothetical protein
MEDWLLMHRFYYGLTQRSCEQLDATVGGSFMSLTLGKSRISYGEDSKEPELETSQHSTLSPD